MKHLTKIAFLALLLASTSCASRKKTVAPVQPQPFEWLTANMDIQAEGNGMNFDDLSGQLRMRKDSLVWLSVTATLGVEVLRAKVSTDSKWPTRSFSRKLFPVSKVKNNLASMAPALR